MADNLEIWMIPVWSSIVTLIIGYYIGNWKAKNDKLLERRTEIFEDILRSLSNLIDGTTLDKGIEETIIELKKSGINILFEEEFDNKVLDTIRDEVKGELHGMGVEVDDSSVDTFLEKMFISMFFMIKTHIGFSIYETQLELNEDVMALKMYLNTDMKEQLDEKSAELNESLQKFPKNEIDYEELNKKASEFAERINEIMKF